MTLLGHVRNGVIVLDSQVSLEEGTPVRVETLAGQNVNEEQGRRADRYRQLLQRLEEWNAKDTADDERLGDLLEEELAADCGMRFRDDPDLDKHQTGP